MKQLAFFQGLTRWSSERWTACRCAWHRLFFSAVMHSWKPRQPSFYYLKRLTAALFTCSSRQQDMPFRCGLFFFGWFGEVWGPWSLITNFACNVDASYESFGFRLLNLTVSPCFLDVFPTSLTQCGILVGTRRRWDFKVNSVEVTWWISSHKLSLKLRLSLRLPLSGSKMLFSINSSLHKLNPISNIFSNSFLSKSPMYSSL